jgi:hypothetical protein
MATTRRDFLMRVGEASVYSGAFTTASKYLERTREIDPTNMTYPQRLLFRIHFRRGERGAAASDLEDFLPRHPDWPQAVKVRQTIAELRTATAAR